MVYTGGGIMKVLLYNRSWRFVKQSGVGHAILHQKEMLNTVGVETTHEWDEDADVIHINTVFPDSLFAIWKARRRGMKIIVYAHSTMEDFRNSFPLSNTLAPLFLKWIRFLYQKGDLVLTPTPYAKSLLEGYGVTRPIEAISNGVDLERFSPGPGKRELFRERYGIDRKATVVSSAGLFIERKGILDFLELARRMPEVSFLWFGRTPRSLMTLRIKRAMRAIPSNVRFPGFLDQETLSRAYCASDMFLFPSYEETEGIVVLEALSSNVPVIVRDIPVYSSWLTHEKDAYKAKDLKEFESAVKKIRSGALPYLPAFGHKVVQRRSLPRIGERLVEIYQRYGIKVGTPGNERLQHPYRLAIESLVQTIRS